MNLAFTVLFAVAVTLAGCAAAPPPRELVDARAAYARASEGPAKELDPAHLLSAQQALQRAERAFLEAPDAPSTRDLAYMAQRRAEIADTDGYLASNVSLRTKGQAEVSRLQGEKLSEARAALASERGVLATKEQELSAEQRARRAAEQRAHAALASLERIAAVKEEARGIVITLNGSVLFATNQAVLLPIAEERLLEVAKALADNPDGAVTVEGHTDSTGSAALNDDLSRRRAEAVREFLVHHGVDADRVKAVGLGSARPVADNKTAEGRANNRRVEIVLGGAR